jgi:hypothetical protein
MQLHTIIENLEGLKNAVLIEKMIPYKKSLQTYFNAQFNDEPMLLVVSVSNAAQYAIVCPCSETFEALQSYDDTLTEEDKETILFNSMLLNNL